MHLRTRSLLGAAMAATALVLAACLDDPVVADIELLTMNPDSVEIVVDSTATFQVTGRGRFGEVVADLRVTWQILGAEEAVEVLSSTTTGSGPTITVRGLQPGTAFVQAEAPSGALRTGTVVVLPEG